jgi:hypothetical protein
VVGFTLQPLYPQEISGTNCTGGWVDLGAVLDGQRKSHLNRVSIPDLFSL